jgi:hypothetical protein
VFGLFRPQQGVIREEREGKLPTAVKWTAVCDEMIRVFLILKRGFGVFQRWSESNNRVRALSFQAVCVLLCVSHHPGWSGADIISIKENIDEL